MRDLLITLGHNASVVAMQDGHVLAAYEAERLTGIKSDSRFPIDALGRVMDVTEGGKFDRALIGHWEPYGKVDRMKPKYWDRAALSQFANVVIAQEDLTMTHHDAHAYAAVAFAGKDFPLSDSGVLVIDGFGTMAEHISYYKLVEGKPVLLRRIYGYETSLGLMYQYATAFLGMKMHEDEYKLLGYGARVREVTEDTKMLDEIAFTATRQWVSRLREVPGTSVDLESLIGVQGNWNSTFGGWLDRAGYRGDVTSEEARRILGYTVQKVLELCVKNLVTRLIPTPNNLIFTGGVGFNVALNRMLLDTIRGKLCVFPLAGDQGNGFGLAHMVGHRVDYGDLCYGDRDTHGANVDDLPEGLYVVSESRDHEKIVDGINRTLESEGFINIVRGKMEFGPRALCNTTTLARTDSMKVVDEINRINGRNTVMPFAPVVWAEYLPRFFPQAHKLHRSEKFMIAACEYANDLEVPAIQGAALQTADGRMTGRPQAYEPKSSTDPIGQVIEKHGILINTSFNVHGTPICCDFKHVVHSHNFQRQHNPNVRTLFLTE